MISGIRDLTTVHVEQALSISRLKSKHSGTEPATEGELSELLYHSLAEKKFHLFGYFEEDVLISWCLIKFGMLHEEKVWIIALLFTSRFHNVFTWNVPELGLLIKHAFEEAEERKVYSYLYSVADHVERVFERQWEKNTYLPPTGRYSRRTLATVKAGLPAAEYWQYRLIGGIKPHDISIKKRTLKEEFR